ncbi:MAG: hypothetical protein PHH31_04135 [Acidaminococcaceae bacterium]|nr:hypothetical protein [Acidaminococcaceae bacterium]MDD4721510.1 hypothetical protein [Acidaminococcaceae bacterium]
MNAKAEKWSAFLKENKIECFGVQEVDNEIHTVVFRAFLEVAGQKLPSMLVLDDSIYSMFQVRVAEKVVTDANKVAVEGILNAYNMKFKVFKYYVGEGGDICLDSCMPATAESFDCNIVHAVIDVILKHLTDEYPKLMKEIWGN